jgi:hypothetical protein
MPPLKVTIAEVPFDVAIEDAALRGRVSRIFGTYLTAAEKPIFRIIFKGSYNPDRNSPPRHNPVTVEKRSGKYFVGEGSKDARRRPLGTIDARRHICCFTLDGSFHFSLIISAVRTCFLFFLERHDGFFLHASSGIVEGKAYTFTGKSDAGKTTALRNLNPERILAGDALAVRVRRGNPRIFAIPFRGDRNACAPAQAVFFPRKFKGAPRVERESAAGAASELLANAMFSSPHNGSSVRPVLKTIDRFCRRVPGFNLYFPRSGSLREVIA